MNRNDQDFTDGKANVADSSSPSEQTYGHYSCINNLCFFNVDKDNRCSAENFGIIIGTEDCIDTQYCEYLKHYKKIMGTLEDVRKAIFIL